MRELTALEARILGVLVEKQATVPDTYPLSLNALVAGCNQKTARQPVMEAAESEVLRALDALRAASLVVEVSGNRVVRYEHNLPRALALPGAAVALLAVLMLRGPQTAAELRLHCERLHRFADVSSVEGFLDELAAKAPPRVRALPRAPGEREPRWAQLLCGADGLPAAGAPAPRAATVAAEAGAAMPARAAWAAPVNEVNHVNEAVSAGGEGAVPAPAGLRFVLPAALKLTHECLIPIRWGDMDAMGHVNNTVYFRYIEVARLEWLYAIGAAAEPRAGQGVVIVNAFCNFLRQIEYPGTLRARHFVANPGRSSFDTYVTLERAEAPGEVCAEGGARTVWTDYATKRALPLPDWLRAHLG